MSDQDRIREGASSRHEVIRIMSDKLAASGTEEEKGIWRRAINNMLELMELASRQFQIYTEIRDVIDTTEDIQGDYAQGYRNGLRLVLRMAEGTVVFDSDPE